MTALEPFPSDTAPISNENQEAGLWLWHGEAPVRDEAPSLPAPSFRRIKRIAHLIDSAAQGATRLAQPNRRALGLALIGLAAWTVVYLLPSGAPVLKTTPAVVFPPVPSPVAAGPARPTPAAAATMSSRTKPRLRRLRFTSRWTNQPHTIQSNPAHHTARGSEKGCAPRSSTGGLGSLAAITATVGWSL
jgi:hypothetical protein